MRMTRAHRENPTDREDQRGHSAPLSIHTVALTGYGLIDYARLKTVRFVARRNTQVRPRGVIRDDLIGLTAHDVVAFAGRLLETPLSISIKPRRSDLMAPKGAEFGNLLCHGRSSTPSNCESVS
jgi:hypothetical protein